MNTSINGLLSGVPNIKKCVCGTGDALVKANLKIENLEKKIKLLTEENKVLTLMKSLNILRCIDIKIFSS